MTSRGKQRCLSGDQCDMGPFKSKTLTKIGNDTTIPDTGNQGALDLAVEFVLSSIRL